MSRQLVVFAAFAAVVLATCDAVAQVTVQMGYCAPQMWSPGLPAPFDGTLRREMGIHWGWVHPTPENQTAVQQDFATIDKVEVCYKQGLNAAVCPFTQSQNTLWRIYEAPSQPVAPNEIAMVDQSEAPFAIVVPADWLEMPSQPKFLFIRMDDEPEEDAVQRGFCSTPRCASSAARCRAKCRWRRSSSGRAAT